MSRPPSWRRPDRLPLPLETPRAAIDLYYEEDAQALFAAVDASRPELVPWLPWAGRTHRDAAESADVIRAMARKQGFARAESYDLGVFDKGTPRTVLGGVGFVRIEADRHLAEIGYWVRTDRCGEGLATEFVGRMITSGFEAWGFRRIVIGCNGENVASCRVAEKLGLTREAREISSRWLGDRGWHDAVGFAVLADAWDGERHRGPAA